MWQQIVLVSDLHMKGSTLKVSTYRITRVESKRDSLPQLKKLILYQVNKRRNKIKKFRVDSHPIDYTGYLEGKM